jgi:signal transduction histidine kinase
LPSAPLILNPGRLNLRARGSAYLGRTSLVRYRTDGALDGVQSLVRQQCKPSDDGIRIAIAVTYSSTQLFMVHETESTRCARVSPENAGVPPPAAESFIDACRVGREKSPRAGTILLAKRRRLACQARARRLIPNSELNAEFLAVFSHEVRSSLAAIHNATLMLRMLHAQTSSVEDKARLLIERQVGRMTRLVDDLLESTRIGSADLSLQSERLDLRSVVLHAIGTVESDLGRRNHHLTTSLPGVPIWLAGDPGRLEQVLVNLLVNASKYTDDGGKISLSAQQQDENVVVRICDSGIGIAQDVLPNVFNLFMQADHSLRRPEGGLGIGLALVKRLIEMHGGSVTAASAGLGQGSEFTVCLPTLAPRAL